MSDRGIYASIFNGEPSNVSGSITRPSCIIIGKDVPRVHHGDGVPVFFIVEHPDGVPVAVNNGTKTPTIKRLIAYPSHWPAPGAESNKFIYAYREPMPWNALIPIFDGGDQ